MTSQRTAAHFAIVTNLVRLRDNNATMSRANASVNKTLLDKNASDVKSDSSISHQARGVKSVGVVLEQLIMNAT
jgi:hypothetical protein